MTTILELCQRIMQRHCQVADAAADLAALVAEQGQEINLLSTLVDTPAGNVARKALLAKAPYFLKYEMAPSMREWIEELVASLCAVVEGVHVPFAEWPRTASGEMAAHAPSEIPPVHAAEFAPDSELDADTVATILSDDNMVDSVPGQNIFGERVDDLGKPLPHVGGRKKTEMTAQEWALSKHFLNYVKTDPFASWSAEQQNAKRDEFVAAMPPDLRMNRWGARFSKFCGVKG